MKTIRKILVIRLREIGDTILATPMLRQLKRIYPEAKLDVVCEERNAEVLKYSPHVSELRPLKRGTSAWQFLLFANRLRREKYDLVIDSQSMPKTAFLTRLTCAKSRLGFKNRWLRNRLCYTEPHLKNNLNYMAVSNLELLQDASVDFEDIRLEVLADASSQIAANKFFQSANLQRLVAVNPVTRFDERRWTPDGYAAIADRLSKLGYQIILLHGPGERAFAIDVAQRMEGPCMVDYPIPSLLELRSILAKCILYVGNDGGPKHLAIAAETPTVTLFGHSPDPWTPPSNPLHRAVASGRAGLTMRSCGDLVHHAPSIQAIPIENVWQQVEIVLQQLRIAA